MNEFDQFVKHKLKIKHYVRYTDDFVIISSDQIYLERLLPPIQRFLNKKLLLNLHPSKVSIRKLRQGVDFLGYIILPHYRLLRTKTKRRIFRKLKERVAQFKQGMINEETLEQSLQSYLGVLSHAEAYRLSQDLLNWYWWRLNE